MARNLPKGWKWTRLSARQEELGLVAARNSSWGPEVPDVVSTTAADVVRQAFECESTERKLAGLRRCRCGCSRSVSPDMRCPEVAAEGQVFCSTHEAEFKVACEMDRRMCHEGGW